MKIIKYIILFLFLFISSDTFQNNIRPHSITITNKTTYLDACYYSYLLSYEIFEIDTLNLIIVYSNDTSFYGMVSPLPFGEHKYLMLLKRGLDDYELKETLSHEFIHIKQFETGRLSSYGYYFIWEGDTINGNKCVYVNRPFEIEAYENQKKIVKKLNKNIK